MFKQHSNNICQFKHCKIVEFCKELGPETPNLQESRVCPRTFLYQIMTTMCGAQEFQTVVFSDCLPHEALKELLISLDGPIPGFCNKLCCFFSWMSCALASHSEVFDSKAGRLPLLCQQAFYSFTLLISDVLCHSMLLSLQRWLTGLDGGSMLNSCPNVRAVLCGAKFRRSCSEAGTRHPPVSACLNIFSASAVFERDCRVSGRRMPCTVLVDITLL